MTDAAALDAISDHTFHLDHFQDWLQDKIVNFLENEGIEVTDDSERSAELKIMGELGLDADLDGVSDDVEQAYLSVEDVEEQLDMVVNSALEDIPGADVKNAEHREAAYDALYEALDWKSVEPSPSPSI